VPNIYGLSEEDVNELRQVVAFYRSRLLVRPNSGVPIILRDSFTLGIPDATINGTTGDATQPNSGTVSVHIFTSTGGTSDSGSDITAYNMSSTSATTAQFVVCARDYQSGNWLIIPTSTAATPCPTYCASGTTPKSVKLILSGVVGNVCDATNCGNLWNATHILPQLSGQPCNFQTTGGGATGCGDIQFTKTAQITDLSPGVNYGWRISLSETVTATCSDTAAILEWDSGGTTAFNCSTQRTLTYINQGINTCCDFSSATGTIEEA
jgi:hypothetical protein